MISMASKLYTDSSVALATHRYEFLRILDMCFALDMHRRARYVADATRIHIISSLNEVKTYRFYEVKISSKL